jgi:hypothetical protein
LEEIVVIFEVVATSELVRTVMTDFASERAYRSRGYERDRNGGTNPHYLQDEMEGKEMAELIPIIYKKWLGSIPPVVYQPVKAEWKMASINEGPSPLYWTRQVTKGLGGVYVTLWKGLHGKLNNH